MVALASNAAGGWDQVGKYRLEKEVRIKGVLFSALKE